MYVVIEMQNGAINANQWVYPDRASAEVKEYQVLADVVKSTIAIHTVMLMSDEGEVIDRKCYKHSDQSAPDEAEVN